MRKHLSNLFKIINQTNAFTMVELLAVVVIIALLSTIALPIITGHINSSKQRAFVENGHTVVSTVKASYASENYLNMDGVTIQNDRIIFSKAAIASLLETNLKNSSYDREYRDISVIILKGTNSSKKYKFYVCMIDEGNNGFDYTNITSLTSNSVLPNITKTCSDLPKEKFEVKVVVDGGTSEVSSKKVDAFSNAEVMLTPENSLSQGSVTCTNSQNAYITDNKLIVFDVSDNTTCSVVFDKILTVLFNDGTLIINELDRNRNGDIQVHGQVTKEYTAYAFGGYVFTKAANQPWYEERASIKKVVIGSGIAPTSTAYWFDGLYNMEEVNLTKLDTSRVTSMAAMFRGKRELIYSGCGGNCQDFRISGKLKSLNLSNFDTSNVTSLYAMFEYQPVLKSLDLTSFDTSKVTHMGYMFAYDNNLETIDLSSFDSSKVRSMECMFYMGRDSNTQSGTFNYYYNDARIPNSLLSTIYASERWSVAGLDLSTPNSTNGMFCNAVSLPHFVSMPLTAGHQLYANYSDTGFFTYKAFEG